MASTYNSAQYNTGHAPAHTQPSGTVQSVYGMYNCAAALVQNDVIRLVRLPAGATVIGGTLQAVDIDTGTETLDIDIGWAANGVDVADPDGLGNLGLWSGDAVTDIKPEVGIFYPLGGVLRSAGPKNFTVETTIQLVVNTAANAGGTGKVWVKVDYVM